MLEKDIEKAILEFLEAMGWFAWKNPTVGTWDQKKGVYRAPRNPYQIRGASDIIAIRDGKVMWLEVKTPKGRQTKHQKMFEKRITENGGFYFVVRSIDDAREAIHQTQQGIVPAKPAKRRKVTIKD